MSVTRLQHAAELGCRDMVQRATELTPVEQWFVHRGVPHFIEDYDAATDIWTRATPVLVIAYLAGGLNALDLRRWTWQRNVLVAVVVVAILLATWAVANVLRRRPPLS